LSYPANRQTDKRQYKQNRRQKVAEITTRQSAATAVCQLQTRSTGTVHTSVKARLIWRRSGSPIRIRMDPDLDPWSDRHHNL